MTAVLDVLIEVRGFPIAHTLCIIQHLTIAIYAGLELTINLRVQFRMPAPETRAKVGGGRFRLTRETLQYARAATESPR